MSCTIQLSVEIWHLEERTNFFPTEECVYIYYDLVGSTLH